MGGDGIHLATGGPQTLSLTMVQFCITLLEYDTQNFITVANA